MQKRRSELGRVWGQQTKAVNTRPAIAKLTLQNDRKQNFALLVTESFRGGSLPRRFIRHDKPPA